MAVSKADILTRALIKLGVIGWGETPETVISADLGLAYNEVYARLLQENLVTWASSADVPDEMVAPIVNLVAQERIVEHSTNVERYQKIMAEAGANGSNAIAQIRARKSLPYQSETTAEYY